MMLLPVCLLAVSCAADQQSAQQAAPTGTKTMSRPQPWAGRDTDEATGAAEGNRSRAEP
jgi:hypothetical protein